MAKLPLINGWEIGWSQDVLVAALERGDSATNASFNVALAYDAHEAAHYLEKDIDAIASHWEGNDADLEFIFNFVKRFRD